MNNWSHGDLILLFFIREDRQYLGRSQIYLDYALGLHCHSSREETLHNEYSSINQYNYE